jgi:hypothetical protein
MNDEAAAMGHQSVLPPAEAADQAGAETTPGEVSAFSTEEAADATRPKRPLPERIAERLGETQPAPLAQIIRMLGLWGPERVKALEQEALTLYQGEGMLTAKGDRKRTAGGIFFYLAHRAASREEWQRISPQAFVPRSQRTKMRKPKPAQPTPAPQSKAGAQPKPQPPAPPPVPVQALTLEAMIEFAKTMKEAPAMNSTMKLIGRPAEVKTSGGCVMFVFTSEKVPALPAGLPPVEAGTKYLVLVAVKQWNKIAPGLEADQEAKLLIEGYPTHQEKFIAVEAMSCKLLSKQAPAAPQEGV